MTENSLHKSKSQALNKKDMTHEHEHPSGLTSAIISISLLLLGSGIKYYWSSVFESPWASFIVYLLAFLPVGIPVLKEGIEIFQKERNLFNECSLMILASIGAFVIGEYPEAVILMILYNIGEWLQSKAVDRARKSISDLVDVRTEWVTLLKDDGTSAEIKAEDAQPGVTLRMSAGVRVSLDGQLLSQEGLLDVSALTGESIPMEISKGEEVLAGSVVINKPIEILVTKKYEDSTLAKILVMTEEAAERKPATERFIRRFAKIYTPIVTAIAALVVIIPWVWSLIHPSYSYFFDEWLYRGLVFLVTSCPCALIISVPLTYYCGVGAASRRGILFKGAIFLERIKNISAAVFDKTGTLTEGRFEVSKFWHAPELSEEEVIALFVGIEEQSTHPMAVAITQFAREKGISYAPLSEIEEQAGLGIKGRGLDGATLLVGSERLMEQFGLEIPEFLKKEQISTIFLARENLVIAAVMLQDIVKEQSLSTIGALRQRNISEIAILSGDNDAVVERVGRELEVDHYYSRLLPDGKIRKVEEMMESYQVLFVGDGLNDAPVMNLAHVGMAMGGIGSDATIEAADVVIQGDNPYKVVEAIDIARQTDRIVLQNIIFALGFKFIVMLLATIGIASLALAIIADVGVTLLVVANSLRAIQKPKGDKVK